MAYQGRPAEMPFLQDADDARMAQSSQRVDLAAQPRELGLRREADGLQRNETPILVHGAIHHAHASAAQRLEETIRTDGFELHGHDTQLSRRLPGRDTTAPEIPREAAPRTAGPGTVEKRGVSDASTIALHVGDEKTRAFRHPAHSRGSSAAPFPRSGRRRRGHRPWMTRAEADPILGSSLPEFPPRRPGP